MIDTQVLLVGGGPAGAACAWKLKQAGIDFLLLDKAEFPRAKVCAGWITPQVLKLLELDPLMYDGNFTHFTRFKIEIKSLRFVLATNQYAIRRIEFDQWLIERVKEKVITHPVQEIQMDGGRYIIDGKYRSTYLVGAGGTHCPVKRALFANPQANHQGTLIVAQEEEFYWPEADKTCRLWFMQNGLPGYAWYFPKSQGMVNIGVGGSAVGLKKHHDTLNRHWKLLVDKLVSTDLVADREFVPVGHSYYLRSRSPVLQSGNAFLVGDAAGVATLDMGEGISPSIQSGLHAAEAIINGKPYSLAGIPRYSWPSLLQLRR